MPDILQKMQCGRMIRIKMRSVWIRRRKTDGNIGKPAEYGKNRLSGSGIPPVSYTGSGGTRICVSLS
jgi:hypothetical protein